jgi:acyl-CoA synthetase (AMP-forming)/AMP-acid ligase II
VHPKYWAETTPQKSAVVMASSGERVTYGELDLRCNRLAQLLRARGLRPGDVIAALMENHPRFFEIFWAAQRSGLYFTPISWRLKTGEAVKAVVHPLDMDHAGPALEAELIDFCRSRIANFKCPRSVDFSADLPRRETGKIYQRLLKQRYAETYAAGMHAPTLIPANR